MECAVIAKKDARWGEIPKGIVRIKPDSNLTAEEIINFTKNNLAHFKALKELEIVDEMPLGGTGKILKSVLRERYGQ